MSEDDTAIPGVYIAWNPWFGEGLHKIGHTGDLRRRLNDGAYVTCFLPDSFRYEATFELATKEDAARLERAALHCCRHRRLSSTSELVRGPTAAELADLVAAAAATLGLEPVRRERPAYPRPPTLAKESLSELVEGPTAGVDWRALVEDLTLPPEEASVVDEFIDSVLALDWSKKLAISPPTPEVARPPDADDDIDDVDDDVDDGSPFDVAAVKWEGLRDYQNEAVESCLVELAATGRTVLQMACRTGKSPVAFSIIRARLEKSTREAPAALFLVPGLPLLRQTAQKMAYYGFSSPILLVGSDQAVVSLCDGRELTMTTTPGAVEQFLSQKGPKLVICTYQSSPLLPTDAFIVTVFDEAHRVCGSRKPRPFNHFILAPRVGERLFMTATPYYDPGLDLITMKDRETFGGVAYRYYLRRGINTGVVNDFRLELVVSPASDDAEDGRRLVGPKQIIAAMGSVSKLLVFSRTIKEAVQLCRETAAVVEQECPGAFECLVAHSKMRGSASAMIRRFNEPGKRIVLFNCNLFREGVEVPSLEGVFFASPRRAARDIVQILCRPLNTYKGKPLSVIFLPVAYNPEVSADDSSNLARFSRISDFVDALADEDPKLFEYLLNTKSTSYPIKVTGTETLQNLELNTRDRIVTAVRRAVRYRVGETGNLIDRFISPEKLSWADAFTELRRTVTVCNRYPKGADGWVCGDSKIEFHKFYSYVQKEYARWSAKLSTKLEPYQIADLQSLPHWDKYGVNGPYIFTDAMQILDDWLTTHNGELPLINLRNGGFICFSATPLERLSGVLTVANQQDGKERCILSPANRVLIEQVAAKWGLTWFKRRGADGVVLPENLRPKTFLEELRDKFTAHLAARGENDPEIQQYYPGYPIKHKRMEELAVIAQNLAPPRIPVKGRGKKKQVDAMEVT